VGVPRTSPGAWSVRLRPPVERPIASRVRSPLVPQRCAEAPAPWWHPASPMPCQHPPPASSPPVPTRHAPPHDSRAAAHASRRHSAPADRARGCQPGTGTTRHQQPRGCPVPSRQPSRRAPATRQRSCASDRPGSPSGLPFLPPFPCWMHSGSPHYTLHLENSAVTNGRHALALSPYRCDAFLAEARWHSCIHPSRPSG
jgi:hypothetical protein